VFVPVIVAASLEPVIVTVMVSVAVPSSEVTVSVSSTLSPSFRLSAAALSSA
jgi:hypothetical protein